MMVFSRSCWGYSAILSSGIVFFLWLYGLGIFYAYIHHCGHHQQIEHKDGVVFTGSPGRIHSGIKLLREKKLKCLFISGISPRSQQTLQHQTPFLPISFGFKAANTRGNIEETCCWARKKNISHITVITADYHIPRCLLLFRRYATHLNVRPYCIKTPLPKRFTHAFREYQKFLWSFLWGNTAKMYSR